MNSLWLKLTSLSLTIQDWLMLSMATIIGLLVVALRVQGTSLHRTQVQLLELRLSDQDAHDGEIVSSAREKFQKAYNDYLAAGGKP